MADAIVVSLLLALVYCQTLSCNAAPEGTTLAEDNWLKYYEDVFAETRQIPLTPEELNERLEIMHNTIDQVRNKEWIKEHMVDAVTSWYGAITDKNASHCNLDHFNQLDLNLYLILVRQPRTINEKRLFEMFYRNIGNFCRQVLAESLSNSLSHRTRDELMNIKSAYDAWTGGEIPTEGLAKRLFGQLNVPRSSPKKEEIIDSWKRGPCNELRQVIDMPDKRSSYSLVRRDVFYGPSWSYKEQDIIDLYFAIGVICNLLDSMVDDMADDYTSGIMNEFGRLVGKHSSQS